MSVRRHRTAVGVGCVVMLASMLTVLVLAGSASAKLTGAFTRFEFCPWKNTEVKRCGQAVTTGGEVVLGSKKVPIVNQAVLQGGWSKAVEKFSKFFEATNGVTLSKAPQPVPGGLLGLVPPEESPPLVAALVELAAENGLTGVNSTLELARPASEIKISELNLAAREGVAMKLPVKAHLENPFLGAECYVGSSETPIWWELTSGKTSPPPPNESIEGTAGKITFLEEGQITEAVGAELVDNAWAAPAAEGCGGWLSFLVDPVINAASGLPAKSGVNTAVLVNTISTASVGAVKRNDEENP
jgi:hypothetical protein